MQCTNLVNWKTWENFFGINVIPSGLSGLDVNRKFHLNKFPEPLVNKSVVGFGLPAPGADPGPTEGAGQAGLGHVPLEAGEAEHVTTRHLHGLDVKTEADGTDHVTQVNV